MQGNIIKEARTCDSYMLFSTMTSKRTQQQQQKNQNPL